MPQVMETRGWGRRLRPMVALGALVLLGGTVSGCAGCSGDPAQAGFSCGVANAVGGTYDQRIAQREAALASSRSTASALEAELAASQTELASLTAQERAMQQQLYRIDQQNHALRNRITVARQQQAASDVRLRQLEAEVAELERRRVAMGTPAPDDAAARAEIQDLQTQIRELDQIIDEILEGEGRVE